MVFNPTAALEFDAPMGGINFGTIEDGAIAISDSVYIRSITAPGEPDSGLVLDMYISSDAQFNGAIGDTCGPSDLNYIPHTAFGYYATKGYSHSGENDNSFPGLGYTPLDNCVADTDGYTNMTVETASNVGNMCRIINSGKQDSLLTQGSEISLTFRLDVPTPCSGSFTDGGFYFVGEIV